MYIEYGFTLNGKDYIKSKLINLNGNDIVNLINNYFNNETRIYKIGGF
jgi:hypothetical protein